MVILHALGQCLIRTSVASIGPRAELGFALATRLIADRGRRLTRRYLTALFWPDADEHRAAHSLSEALHRLRARGIPIESDPSHAVWLSRDAAGLDVERIPEIAPPDLARCDFSILPGFDPHGSSALMDWADEFRHHLRVETVRNTAIVIRRAEREGDWPNALALAEHVLRLDPEDPDALDARARAAEALRRSNPTSANGRPTPPSRIDVVRETPPTHCKGRDQTPGTVTRTGIFVGREHELNVLKDAWDHTIDGSGRSVRISGESGIGKSRLIREFCAGVRRSGGAVAEAACDPPDSRKPMSTLMRLVPRLRRLPGAAGCAPELVPYLDRLTEHDPIHGRLPDAADIPYLSTCVENAVEELVDAIADEQPLVVVIDNAQWMDSDSARVIDSLARRAMSRPILLLVATCESIATTDGPHCQGAIPIRLDPLPDVAAASLVRALTKSHDAEPSAAAIDWFVQTGEGHPLWLAELVEYWVATGKDFTVPPTLAALLDDRIARLTSLQRRILQVAALLGHGATVKRTQRIVGADNGELLDALDALGSAGLLTVERGHPSPDGTELTCRHDAIAAAAVAQLTAPALALLHQQIALILDDESERSASAELLWDRAAHWTASDRTDRVLEVGLGCIRHLVEIGLVDAAITACRELTVRCTNEQADRVNRTLAEIFHLAHRWDEFAQVAHAVQRAPDAHDDIELLVLDADWQRRRDWVSTLAATLRCAASTTASSRHRIRSATLALKIATNLGDLDAIQCAHHAVSDILGSQAAPTTDELTFEMIHAAIDGCGEEAVRHARALLDQLARSLSEDRLRLMLNCAVALARGGAVDEAEEVCDQVYRVAPRLGLPRLSLDACRRAALMMLDHGRFEIARSWMRRIDDGKSVLFPPNHQAALRVVHAKLALVDGQPENALELLARFDDERVSAGVPMLDAAVLAVRIIAKIMRCAEPTELRTDVLALDALENRLTQLGGQDYEMVALAAGRGYVGQAQDGKALFANYLAERRRDVYPLPTSLADMLDRLLSQAIS